MKHLGWCVVGCALFEAMACNRSERSEPSVREPAARERVLLEGSFRSVGKSGTGRARIVRAGDQYELRLEGVELAAEGAHVYLVGLEDARTSSAVDQAELKYDMGALEGPDQRIALPSAPDPALRVVVLWNPRFSVNLAAAPLRAP